MSKKFGKKSAKAAREGLNRITDIQANLRSGFDGRVKPSLFRGQSKTATAINRIGIVVESLKEMGANSEAISTINRGLKRIKSEEKGNQSEMDATINTLNEMVSLYNGITLEIEPEYTKLGKAITDMIGEVENYNAMLIDNKAYELAAVKRQDDHFKAIQKTEGIMKDIDDKNRAIAETAEQKEARIKHENNLRRKFGVSQK